MVQSIPNGFVDTPQPCNLILTNAAVVRHKTAITNANDLNEYKKAAPR
jgi:hypothetical protein